VPDNVRNNTALNRFELDLDGATAAAYYTLSPGVITFTHTEVPAAMSGHGIGSHWCAARSQPPARKASRCAEVARSCRPTWPSIRNSMISCCSQSNSPSNYEKPIR